MNSETAIVGTVVATPKKKIRQRKQVTAKSGLTVEGIRKRGHKIAVMHLRFAQEIRSAKRNPEVTVMPANLDNPKYVYLGHGGFTHISVKTKSGKEAVASSRCSLQDNYWNKYGVALCLDRLPEDVIAELQAE